MDIGAWGDSITYGANDTSGLGGWVGRLRRDCYETVYGFYNRGVCGDTTEDILRRFDIEVSSIEPNVIILAAGINDSKFPKGEVGNMISLEKYRENITALISKALSRTHVVIAVGLTKVNESKIDGSSIFKNSEITKYNSVFKEIANDKGVQFIDMQEVLDANTDLDDGLHPNDKGYDKMAALILPVLKRSLPSD